MDDVSTAALRQLAWEVEMLRGEVHDAAKVAQGNLENFARLREELSRQYPYTPEPKGIFRIFGSPWLGTPK